MTAPISLRWIMAKDRARQPAWPRRTAVVLHVAEAVAWLIWGLDGAGLVVGIVFALALVALGVSIAFDHAHTLTLANAVATLLGGPRLLHNAAPGAVVAIMVMSVGVLAALGFPWKRRAIR